MPGEKRKMGRPPTGIGPVVGVRLYPDIEEALEAGLHSSLIRSLVSQRVSAVSCAKLLR
jgi:hypothetical protein